MYFQSAIYSQVEGKVYIDVVVSENAIITINGKPTRQTGTVRKFISYVPYDGLEYRYTVTSGSQSYAVKMSAGQSTVINFMVNEWKRR